MDTQKLAGRICEFLREMPEVVHCCLYGSLMRGSCDAYSDIDLEVDVSGCDNGAFILELPKRFSERFDVIFFDYAPSLAPEKYVVTLALDAENPFATVDIAAVATPHMVSVSRQDLNRRNNLYDHTLKLFSANLKHFLRGADCRRDIEKMYSRLFDHDPSLMKKSQMLREVYSWLKDNTQNRHRPFVAAFEKHMEKLPQ